MKLPISKEQISFLEMIGIENKEYSESEIEDIVENVCNHLMMFGWKHGHDYEETNDVGNMCESIITALTKK